MKMVLVLILSIFIIACSTNPLSDISDYDLTTQYRQETQERAGQYCQRRLLIARERYRRDKSSTSKESVKNFEEFYCAWSERRWNDAYTWLQLLEKNSENYLGWQGFYLASITRQHSSAVERLKNMNLHTDHRVVTDMEPRIFWVFIRNLESNKEKKLRNQALDAMIDSQHYQKLDPYFKSSLASRKLSLDANDGIFINSDSLIDNVISPRGILEMLADKKFEPLWPKIEQRAGENLSVINSREIDEAMALYNKDESDLDAYSKVAHALLFAGKFDEVISFVKIPAIRDLPFITEHEAWALNAKVYALDAVNQHDTAENIFENIVSIPRQSNKGWLVNFAINQATRLLSYGYWQKSLDAANYAEEFDSSDYAKMLIRATKACALFKLEKMNEASQILDEIYKHRSDSYVSATRAMLCADQEENAAKIALDGLNDESYRSQMLRDLQEQRFSLNSSVPNYLDIHRLLETSSELKLAFEEKGRLIPSKFIPLAGLRRSSP